MARAVQFDDRVDTQTELTTGQTLSLLGRSIGFLRQVRMLFVGKVVFAVVAVFPLLLTPWILKIVVDQVVLGQPFEATEARTPVFLQPFVNAIRDLPPSEIMLAVTGLLLLLLFLFGFRAPPAEQVTADGMALGFDSATQ
ncbi:MAG: hypothetical protein AAFN50_13830, partial [Pseudomonadota bacterium]